MRNLYNLNSLRAKLENPIFHPEMMDEIMLNFKIDSDEFELKFEKIKIEKRWMGITGCYNNKNKPPRNQRATF